MNILLISYSRIGDTILATSLINYLIDNNPSSSFTIVTSSISKDIFRDMPQLSNLIVIDKEKNSKHWFKIWNMNKSIKWDLVVDLRSSYLSYFLRTKKRMIFRGNEKSHKIEQFKSFLGCDDDILPKIWANPVNYNYLKQDKKLTNKLADLNHKISLINKNDPDYLDILYRQKFNYVTEDEIIIKLK